MEKVMIVSLVSCLFVITFQFIQILRLKKSVKWFEDWGRKYLDKHKEEARKDGLISK